MLDRRLTTDRNEVENVTSHVVRIPLPLPLSDLRLVNVYAILGDDGVTLVDSGWADEPSESVIIEALCGLGFAPGDVRRILVTHAHWDHFSRAILWQRCYGTTVLLGRQEHHTIEAFDEIDGAYPMQASTRTAKSVWHSPATTSCPASHPRSLWRECPKSCHFGRILTRSGSS